MGRCIRNNILITLVMLLILGNIMEAYAITVNFSIDTFKLNHIGDSDSLDEVVILSGYNKIYKPADNIEVTDISKIKLSTYCEQLNTLEGKPVLAKAVYHGDRVDWIYIIDPDGNFSGWVDGGQLYTLPDGVSGRKATNLDRDEILQVSGDGYSLTGNMANAAAFVDSVTDEGFITGEQITKEDRLKILYGFNEISLDTSGVFYDTTDKYQITVTILIIVALIFVMVYAYSTLWGESSEDALATTIMSSVIMAISVAFTVLLIKNIIGITSSTTNIGILETIVIISPILAGIVINGFALAELDRTGKPLKFSICLYGLIYSVLITILLIYNKEINPQLFGFLTQSRLFYSTVDINSVRISEITFTMLISVMFVFIAVKHRYEYSYSFDRQSTNAVKIRELMEALREETYKINEYMLPKKYKRLDNGYLSYKYYKNGLPTLNDLIKRRK